MQAAQLGKRTGDELINPLPYPTIIDLIVFRSLPMKRAMSIVGLFLIPALMPTAALSMDLTSSSFSGGKIKKESACSNHGGKDVSPQISISSAPPGTTHFAVIIDDPDAVPVARKTWVHWNVVNIPADKTDFAAGETPPGSELTNHNKRTRYAGMCPPNGTHTYRLAVYALKAPIETGGFFGPSMLTQESFQSKYSEQILDQAQIDGAFP